MSSTLGFRPEGNPDDSVSPTHSPLTNNIPLSAPQIIPAKDFPSHMTLSMVNQWRQSEAEHFDRFMKNCSGQELPLSRYENGPDLALDMFERRSAFLAGEVYERLVLDRRMLVRYGGSEIVCSQLVHYAPQDCPTLSLFVSDEKVENVSLFPCLTRIESCFSSSGGAREWEFSRNDATPFFSQMAYRHALQELERFDGVTIDFDRRSELPLMLRLAVERSRAPLPKSLYPDESRQVYIGVEREDSMTRVSFSSGEIRIELECSLANHRPIFNVALSRQGGSSQSDDGS